MKRVVQLVDSIEYISSNCFQHQLANQLRSQTDLTQVTLAQIVAGSPLPDADVIVSCLKQRTLLHRIQDVQKSLSDRPVVIYEQDPWECFSDAGHCRGSYDMFRKLLNVKKFCVTTQWWVPRLRDRGYEAEFVRLWVAPEYCDPGRDYEDRPSEIGFIGSVHPRRKQLIDVVEANGFKVSVRAGNSLSYGSFMKEMSQIGCFIHNEDMPMVVDGVTHNFGTGMWVKDIEAVARGCFSIRNRCEGYESYDIDKLPMIRLYDSQEEIPGILRSIREMDPWERGELLRSGVDFIKGHSGWSETVSKLIA